MAASPPITVPRLQTPRLLLREYRTDDFDAFAAHLADPQSTVHLGAADRLMAWRIFACHAGLWLLHGAGWWSVEVRGTGQLVGHVGAFFRERSTRIEIGWSTYREFWGQGFASEAAAGAVRHAWDARGEPDVHALIDAGNAPSIRVAEHLGMRYDADTVLFGKPVQRYVLARPGQSE